jgi:hypothetical protein
MSAEVSYSGSEFTLEITDETNGQTFTTTGTSPTAERSSAEWSVETPSVVTGFTNLADFTKASFGDDYTGIADTNDATDSTVSGPIGDFGSAVNQITQIDYLDYTESTSSALTKDGTSFKVTWVEYN